MAAGDSTTSVMNRDLIKINRNNRGQGITGVRGITGVSVKLNLTELFFLHPSGLPLFLVVILRSVIYKKSRL